MEVRTTDQTSFSLGSFFLYSTLTAILVGLILTPSLLWTHYARILNTILLVALWGLVGRTVVSTGIAFFRGGRPDLPDNVNLPTVSVVIPAYNEADVLPETIGACQALDYPAEKLEVIICYEADSTDGTADIAERAAAKDPRFKAVERDEEGGGKAKATNYALQYTAGEIIASIDADHQFEPLALRRAVVWFLDDEDTWCVKGRCYGRNPTDSIIALHATVERHIAEKADIFARQVFDGFTFFGGGQAFFRADVFEELGRFDEEVLVEDIDMSSRIHAAGKNLHIDPTVITYEENPPTLAAWWNQRKRWARGWMQVASRYLPRLASMNSLSTLQRMDAMYTFVYAIVPALLIVALPMGYVSELTSATVTSYIPMSDSLLWTFPFVAPALVAYLIFLQDWRDGYQHHPAEYAAAFTLGPYLILQTAVFVTAFLEEYLLRKPSVYVTTSRSGIRSEPNSYVEEYFRRLRLLVWNEREGRPRAAVRISLFWMAYTSLFVSIPVVIAPSRDGSLRSTILRGLLVCVTLGLIYGAAVYLDRRPVRTFGLKIDRRWLIDAIVGVAIGGTIPTVAVGFGLAGGWLTVSEFEYWSMMTVGYVREIGLAIIVTVSIAVVEELVFRGYILTNAVEGLDLRRFSEPTTIAIAWGGSALLFAIAHPAPALMDGLHLLSAGLLLGLAYLHSGQLGLPIGIHAGFNFLSTYVFPMASDPSVAVFSVTVHGPAWLAGQTGLVQTGLQLPAAIMVLGYLRWQTGDIGIDSTTKSKLTDD